MLLGSAEVSKALARDYREAPITEADRIMLDYAVKVTRTPHAVTEEDVARLREVGFDDQGILDICQVTCYYNYVNRLADGLGVQLEEHYMNDQLTITREEFEQRVHGSADER